MLFRSVSPPASPPASPQVSPPVSPSVSPSAFTGDVFEGMQNKKDDRSVNAMHHNWGGQAYSNANVMGMYP